MEIVHRLFNIRFENCLHQHFDPNIVFPIAFDPSQIFMPSQSFITQNAMALDNPMGVRTERLANNFQYSSPITELSY